MDGLLDFLANNYIYFMVGAVLLLFALIGFIFGGKRKKKKEEEILQGETPMANTVVPDPVVATTPEVGVINENVQEQPVLEQTEAPTLNFDAQAPSEPSSIFDMPQENMEPTMPDQTDISSEPAIGEPITMNEPVAEVPVSEPVAPEVPVEPVVEPVAEVPVREPVAPEVPVEPVVEPVTEVPVSEPVTPEVPVEPVAEVPVSEPVTPEVPVEPMVEPITEVPVSEPVTPEVPVEPMVEPVTEVPAGTTEESTTPLV